MNDIAAGLRILGQDIEEAEPEPEEIVYLMPQETETVWQEVKNHTSANAQVSQETPSVAYEVRSDSGFDANVKIMEINRTGAVIVNSDNWQAGEEHELELTVDDQKVKVKFVVTKVERNAATVKFIDLPAGLANKIAYLYMSLAQNK